MQQLDASPEHRAFADEINSFQTQKLWHQLTVSVNRLLQSSLALPDPVALVSAVFTPSFVHIDPFAIGATAVRAARRSKNTAALRELGQKVSEGRTRFAGVQGVIPRSVDEGLLVIDIQLAEEALVRTEAARCKEEREAIDARVAAFPGLRREISMAYNRYLSEYYAAFADPQLFYRHTLKYLELLPKDEALPAALPQLVQQLGIAGLFSDQIYNFAELFENESVKQHMLSSAADSANKYIYALLLYFQSPSNPAPTGAVPQTLAHSLNPEAAGVLYEKLRIMRILDLFYSLPPSGRSVSLDKLNALPISIDFLTKQLPAIPHIESVIMRCLARGLIKGRIDQVTGILNVTYIRPRPVARADLRDFIGLIDAWTGKINTSIQAMTSHAAELFHATA